MEEKEVPYKGGKEAVRRTGVKIKICGLRREEDISAVNAAGADYAGFLFYPKSFRYVTPERAKELRKKLAPRIRAVGVFVNEDPARILELYRAGVIDCVQLHGQEDASYVRRLRTEMERNGGRNTEAQCILQAFRIDTARDILRANESAADLILLDHGAGGSGEAFDWDWIREVRRPYFLAGGLTPENVTRALTRAAVLPYALDVSSGVEMTADTAPERWKDPEKIRRFAAAVRAWERKSPEDRKSSLSES